MSAPTPPPAPVQFVPAAEWVAKWRAETEDEA